jgi:polyvinyl alcohol dehydrogenase (cytochrome)
MAVIVAAGASVAAAIATAGPDRDGAQSWPMAGQNLSDTHYQAAEHKISPANAAELAPKWTLTTAGAVSAIPAVDHGTVYVPDYGGKLWAVAARTGQVLWSRAVSDYTSVAGDVSRTTPAVSGDELILGDGWILNSTLGGAHVFAVNRHSGRLLWSTQVDTDPTSVITGAPVVYRGVAYVGISSKEEGVASPTFRGAIIAIDVKSGKLLWKTYTVPSNNGNSDSNQPGYYSGNPVWNSSPVIDPARGLLFVGTGNNYSVPDGVCTSPTQTGCTPSAPDNYVDSILALKLRNGTIAWADHTLDADLWTVAKPLGPDFDLGAGPNLFTTTNPVTGRTEQLLGIGQKSGVYWAVHPDTGKVAWQTVVGPAGNGGTGGIEWGSATDGRRIYVAEADTTNIPYTLGGVGPHAGQTVTGGSWAALDPATGRILWQTPDPAGAFDTSFVSAANGVVYGGSLATSGTNMYALDAGSGKILWSFASGGSVSGGAAIADGSVYWGSGYCGAQCLTKGTALTNNDELYGFSLR